MMMKLDTFVNVVQNHIVVGEHEIAKTMAHFLAKRKQPAVLLTIMTIIYYQALKI